MSDTLTVKFEFYRWKKPQNILIIDKNDNEVDAISGATITGDGVSDMIKERLENYLPYFNNLSNE